MTGAPRPRPPNARPIVIKPYSTPAWGWRRWVKPAVSLPLAFFFLVYGFFYALTTPYLFMAFAAPIGVLALVAIWALPDLKHAPTRTMHYLFFAFFVCLILWPNYLAIALPGLPWITLLRLTGIPMALLLLICISTSKTFRRELAEILNTAPAAWMLLAAFVAIQFFTIGLSANPSRSIQKFIVFQTNWTAIFLVACYVFVQPGRVGRYIAALWVMAMIICGIGIWEAAIQKVLWQGHIPGFLKIADADGILAGDFRAGSGQYRVKATFTTSLGLAEYLALMTPFLLHYVFGNYRLLVRIAAAASLVIFFRVIDSTDSRLGMVGMLIAVLLYAGAWGLLRWRRDKSSLIGPTVVLAYPAFFVLLVGATFFIRRLEMMVWGDGSQQSSNDARGAQIAQGLPKILANPIGYGPGQGGTVLGFTIGGFQTIDNYYLAIALEYGVIGFILYYGLILYMGWLAARKVLNSNNASDREVDYLVPLGISLMVFFVIKSVFSQQDNHPLIYLVMGMIVALLYRLSKTTAPGKSAADPIA